MQVTAVLVFMHPFHPADKAECLVFLPAIGCSAYLNCLVRTTNDHHQQQSVHASQGYCCTAPTASRRWAPASPRCCCSAAC
jgi:hypothetical protein